MTSTDEAPAAGGRVALVDATRAVAPDVLHAALAGPGLSCVVLDGTAVAARDLDASVLAVAGSAVPVVAAVRDDRTGEATALALAADLRVLAPTSGLTVEPLLGGVSWSLPRAAGTAVARRLLVAPRTVGADEALALGLADAVDPDPLAAALALAEVVARRSPALVAAAKRSLDDADGLRAALEREARLRAVAARAGTA